ncbi:hypothetical protein [Sinomicrobium sp.]
MNRLRLSAAALALIAAFAFASQSKGDQNYDYQVRNLQQEYRITDPDHEDFGLTGPKSQIDPLCPGTGQECAVEVGGTEVIEWEGPTTKF